MRVFGVKLYVWILALAGTLVLSPALLAQAQQTAPSAVSQASQPSDQNAETPGNDRKRAVTPEETEEQLREKAIQQIDPLSKSPTTDPTDVTSPTTGAIPSTNPGGSQTDGDQNLQPLPDRRLTNTPLPNSIAASAQPSTLPGSGPRVVSDENAGSSQTYAGPAVLSRSYSLNRPLIAQQLKWSESIGVGTFYDSGLVTPTTGTPGVGTGNVGNINDVASWGNQVTWGLSGRHNWHKDQLGLSFSGNRSTAVQQGSSAGTNMSLTADGAHVISRRLSLQGSFTGTLSDQNYALESPTVAPDTNVANVNFGTSPEVQIFDNGTKQMNSQLALVWQENARLSFNMGVAYFATVRDSPLLNGVTGQQANGDVNYRITRTTTIGAYYSYSNYLYPHGTGQTASQTVGGIYSWSISRSTQLRLRGGISHTESNGLQTVSINPLIAQLLGVSSGIIDSYRVNNGLDISAQLVHDFRGSRSANIAYAQGITPGNGVYLASEQQSLTGGYSMKLWRRYDLSFGGGWSVLSSQAQTLGKQTTESVSATVSRGFARGLTNSLGFTFRHYSIFDAPAADNEYRIVFNVSWGNTNGRLWPF